MTPPRIVIPDDAPPVMGPSPAYRTLLDRQTRCLGESIVRRLWRLRKFRPRV